MPEYFSISFIMNNMVTDVAIENCLHHNKLKVGQNESNIILGTSVLTTIYKYDWLDYIEIEVAIPNQIFHKEKFDLELNTITELVKSFFECLDDIVYAVCSYEIGSNILSNVSELDEIKNILEKFPIAYKRDSNSSLPIILINLDAQDIFTENPFGFGPY